VNTLVSEAFPIDRGSRDQPKIVMMNVVTALSHTGGIEKDEDEHSGWDLVAQINRQAQESGDKSLGPELDGLTSRGLKIKGDVTHAILETAQQEKADLIMMPSYGYGFDQFLVGSVTPKMLYGIDCPVWPTAVSVRRLAPAKPNERLCCLPVAMQSEPPECRYSWSFEYLRVAAALAASGDRH
jgi:hypothetical protein